MSKNENQKGAYLDKAQGFIDKALLIYPDESELYVLQALLYQGKTQTVPLEEALSYLEKASETLSVAKDYNPDNPRVYYLLGLNILNAPEAIGGGAEKACPEFETAREKFRDDVPQNVLSPTWGGEENDRLYRQHCNENE
jgi:tetratricopeptide (TPR) repeat protein